MAKFLCKSSLETARNWMRKCDLMWKIGYFIKTKTKNLSDDVSDLRSWINWWIRSGCNFWCLFTSFHFTTPIVWEWLKIKMTWKVWTTRKNRVYCNFLFCPSPGKFIIFFGLFSKHISELSRLLHSNFRRFTISYTSYLAYEFQM